MGLWSNNEKVRKVKLGQEVRDKITGYTGIAMMEVEFLFGCNQIGVSMKMNNNEIKDAEFFDEGRLEKIGDGVPSQGGIPDWPTSIKLGNDVKDRITGFRGLAVARSRYLFGTVKFGVAPKVNENGELKGAEFFDVGRLEIMGTGIAPEEVQTEKKGGISRDVPRGVR